MRRWPALLIALGAFPAAANPKAEPAPSCGGNCDPGRTARPVSPIATRSEPIPGHRDGAAPAQPRRAPQPRPPAFGMGPAPVLWPLPGDAPRPRPADCDASGGVSLRLDQRYSGPLGAWLYDLEAANASAGGVAVHVSVYDDEGRRQNTWRRSLRAGESRRIVERQPLSGANRGHVGRVRYAACRDDRACRCDHPR